MIEPTVALVVGGVIAILIVCAVIAYGFYRLKRSHGRADEVTQLFCTEGALYTVEMQISGASRGPTTRDARLCRRSPLDGTVACRVDVHETFRVLGIDGQGRVIANDVLSPIHARDATTLETIRIDVLAPSLRASLAPFASMDARVSDGALSVLDRIGQRVPMRDAIGTLAMSPDVAPRNDVQVNLGGGALRLVGSPRAHLERHGRPFGTLELLGARLFGAGMGTDALVISELDLALREAVITRVDAAGSARYATPLGRPAEHVSRAVITGDFCVMLLRAAGAHPLELVAIDLGTGTVRWRCVP